MFSSLLVLLAVISLGHRETPIEHPKANQYAADTNYAKLQTPSPVRDNQTPEQTNPQSDKLQTEEDENTATNRWNMALTGLIAFATVVQAVILFFQTRLFGRQTELMDGNLKVAKDTADTALRSVKLQEAQLKQWVELDEWEGHSEHFFPKATRTTYWMTFWVTNPTKMPLTLKKVYITVPDGRPVFRSENDSVISPENGHRINWPTVVTDETMKQLVEGRWAFTLVIDVDFVDVFGEDKHSQFTVACKCRSISCEVDEYHNRQPT